MKTKSNKTRSESWKNAKLSGHLNEVLVAKSLDGCREVGHKKVESVLGRKTPMKPDIVQTLGDISVNLSLKKSLSGQAHMNKVPVFIKGYEKIFGEVPKDVTESLLLTFGGSSSVKKILTNPLYEHENKKIMNTQLRRQTICFDTFRKYDNTQFENLIDWMKNNVANLATIVLKTGWASDSNFHAHKLMYNNMVDENVFENKVFDIDAIIQKSKEQKNKVFPKTKNGGTVINLPFGWLQYHQGGLQFHHSYSQVSELFVD